MNRLGHSRPDQDKMNSAERPQTEARTGRAHLDTTAGPELIFSLSSPEEERRSLLWNAPLPTRASQGENFW